MKPLTIDDCTVQLIMFPEDLPLEGNLSCLDDERDAANIAHVRDQLDSGNDWAWCAVTVRLTYRGLIAEDHLGGCSYASEADFTAPGGYYDDMIHECLISLNKQLAEICAERCSE